MKKHILISVISLASIVLAGYGYNTVYANPSQIRDHMSAAATSTLSYMTGGTATTTNAFDTQNDGGFPADSATLAFQVTATSTGVDVPKITVRFEDSDDGIDWYSRAVSVNDSYPTTVASTTVMVAPEMSFLLSTSSANSYFGSGSLTRLHYNVPVGARMRYVRAVFYVPIGGGKMGIWSDIYVKKQTR